MLRHTGSCQCFGSNSLGQLGYVGDGFVRELYRNAPVPALTAQTLAGIWASGDFSCALTADGEVACWGSNSHGQLGTGSDASILSGKLVQPVPLLEPVSLLALGSFHACALMSRTGNVWCWGLATSGQVGLSNLPSQTLSYPREPVPFPGD